MPRVSRDDMPANLAERHDTAMEVRDDATFFEIGAHAPEILDWYHDSFYAKVFYGGRVEVKIKELLRYRLSMTHGCAFCNKGNSGAAMNAGVTEAQLANIMNESSEVFTPAEAAILKLADQIAIPNMSGTLDKALYAELKPHFSDGEIFELGVTAAVLTGMAKFLFVFDLVEREANCPIVPRVAAE
jgi:alkylhydroperoxidase family enzyme